MLSYAQHFEDMHLWRALGAQTGGVYIDVGAGHPIYDNVSLAFYLNGWRGITVEPNPWLAELSAALRPRDAQVQALLASTPGEATYYLVEDFHGLSTTVASNAQAALDTYGKPARQMTRPATTLAALCEAHALGVIDFLKIDVEGAERAVLLGNDWTRYRPKIVTLEALEPVTMKPSWEGWEPILLQNGYRFALFDGLNRYYVADEQAALAPLLADAPASFDDIVAFRTFKPAAEDANHPDHVLARQLTGLDPVRLPLLPHADVLAHLIKDLSSGELTRVASEADIAAISLRLFGVANPAPPVHRSATIREAYVAWIASDTFRIACGRISASHAW